MAPACPIHSEERLSSTKTSLATQHDMVEALQAELDQLQVRFGLKISFRFSLSAARPN